MIDSQQRETASVPWRAVQRLRMAGQHLLLSFERLCAPLAPIYHRLLDTSRPKDYLIAAAIGTLPLIISFACGTFRDVPPTAASWQDLGGIGPPPTFRGIASRPNWGLLYIVVLPVALICIRQIARRLFCLGTDRQCAIVELVAPEHRAIATAETAIAATRPSVFGVVLLLALVLNFVDVGEVLQHYAAYTFFDTTTVPRERDWSVFFLVGEADVGIFRNFLFVVLAYTLQGIAILLGFLVFGLALVHNTLYLRLVYQRHRRQDPTAAIVLNFDDPNRRFGQSALHAVFDWQVVFLLIAGVAILGSRYANARADTGALWEGLIDAVSERDLAHMLAAIKLLFASTTRAALFPDVGQIALLLGFSFCALCVLIPSFLKFLPYGRIPHPILSSYLAEFVPLNTTPNPETMNAEELDKLAEKFAGNAFWPAGDTIARWLFGAVFFVLATILIPIPREPVLAFTISVVVVVALAYLAMSALFWVYRQALRIIDPRLVPKE